MPVYFPVPKRNDLCITRGGDFEYAFIPMEAPGQPLNMTDWTAKMQIWRGSAKTNDALPPQTNLTALLLQLTTLDGSIVIGQYQGDLPGYEYFDLHLCKTVTVPPLTDVTYWQLTMRLTAAQTVTVTEPTGIYDLKLTDATDGAVNLPMWGEVTFIKDITQPDRSFEDDISSAGTILELAE